MGAPLAQRANHKQRRRPSQLFSEAKRSVLAMKLCCCLAQRAAKFAGLQGNLDFKILAAVQRSVRQGFLAATTKAAQQRKEISAAPQVRKNLVAVQGRQARATRFFKATTKALRKEQKSASVVKFGQENCPCSVASKKINFQKTCFLEARFRCSGH